ncbi:MAG: hypothetical protein CMP76_17255 [Flavobacterium sp.]|uniref:tail assembly chaperone n=1 Tax=Flavobacterium sp. TaxID=239 RepID=UPI000C5A8BF6|nr:tail assembly chaperone [Flavobacterium sp.]MBF05027.1 hypothetical protein [Flavobacterium sp.]|tara:strand:+ start:1454 stop:1840 length:387 start_codon:yes stop_codon:yes gene_type:complete
MGEVKININGKEYILKFGMYFLRQLSERWNLPYFNDILKKFQAFENIDPDNLPWDVYDVVVDIYYVGISLNKENEIVSREDLYDEVLKDMDQTLKVMQVMVQSLVSFFSDEKKSIPVSKKNQPEKNKK